MGWLTGWGGRFPTTSQNAKVLEVITDGRYLLENAPAEFWAAVKNGGGDIRVTKADGTTEVAREVVSCDTATDKGEIFYDTTGIQTGSDVLWYVYYGNAAANDYAEDDPLGREAVYHSMYKMVQHCDDITTSTTLDSTSNDNDGAKHSANNPTEIAGLGGGKAQDFDGTLDYINCGASAELNITAGSFTAMVFMKSSTYETYRRMLSQYAVGPERFRFALGFESTNRKIRFIGSPILVYTHGSSFYDGNWHGIFVTYDGSDGRIFTDGVLRLTATWAPFATGVLPNTVIGDSPTQGDTEYTGLLDEVRLLNTDKSTNWLTTMWNNINDPGTFWVTGAAELPPPAPTGIAPGSGVVGGGTAVTITGTDFVDGASVTIGGVAATGVVFVNSTSITAVTPAGTAGAKDVVVTNPDTQTGTDSGAFTYLALPTVDTFTATPATIDEGDSSTLAWTTTDAGTSVSIDNGVGAVAEDGSTVVSPTVTTTYTITATGPGGVDTDTVTVTVTPTPEPEAGGGVPVADSIRRTLGRYRRPRR